MRGLKIVGTVFAAAIVVLLLATLFLSRSDIPYATLEPLYASSASRYVDIPGGIHLHYRVEGNQSAPTLLLIHGFGSSLETWKPWVAHLRDRYRLVSVDLPGHGLTRAEHFSPSVGANVEVLVAFSQAIDLRHVTAVGNSLGGAVAWNLALRVPALVNGLVLVDASGWEWERQSNHGQWIFELLGSAPIAPLIRDVDKTPLIRQTLLSAYYDKSLVTPAMIRRNVDFSRAPGHRAILDRTMIQTISGGDLDVMATDGKLAAIHVPALILWGANDELVAPTDAQKFTRSMSNSTVIVYPNVGHVPMEEVASRSAADLDSWIRRTLLKD